MPAATVDFACVENEDFLSPLIHLKNSDGSARSLAGTTLHFQVRQMKGATGTPLLDLTNGSGILVISPASSGVIQINFARFVIPAGDYWQDLIEDHTDFRTAIFSGWFYMAAGVTRWT
jgi:hypothetical protein